VIDRRKDIYGSILSSCPSWASIRSQTDFEIRLIAQIKRVSGKITRSYDLLINILHDGKVAVQEVSTNALLPLWCPQRHINANGTFCIGLRADSSVNDAASAENWWRALEVFLSCQETAFESRKWPPTLQLSHGDAADIQLRAEALAQKLNREKDYEAAVAYNEGPIAGLSRHVSRITGRLTNPQAPCMCGYTRGSQIKHRKDCARDNNLCLVVLENRRRKAELSFWRALTGKLTCCGTIDDCPIRKEISNNGHTSG